MHTICYFVYKLRFYERLRNWFGFVLNCFNAKSETRWSGKADSFLVSEKTLSDSVKKTVMSSFSKKGRNPMSSQHIPKAVDIPASNAYFKNIVQLFAMFAFVRKSRSIHQFWSTLKLFLRSIQTTANHLSIPSLKITRKIRSK